MWKHSPDDARDIRHGDERGERNSKQLGIGRQYWKSEEWHAGDPSANR